MSDVSFTDTVQDVCTNRSKEHAINGTESTSLEVPHTLSVVRQSRVSVLEESDGNKPVVYPEIRNEVVRDHLSETSLCTPIVETAENQANTQIRSDDLGEMTRVKDCRRWVEVIGASWIVLLTRSVSNQVHWPADELLEEEVDKDGEWSVLEEFRNLQLLFFRHVDTGENFLISIFIVELRAISLSTCFRDKDLVSRHVTGGSVVFSMANSPAVVRDKEEGVEDETDRIVDGFAGGVGLMAAFMGNDPQTSPNEAQSEPKEGPERGRNEKRE